MLVRTRVSRSGLSFLNVILLTVKNIAWYFADAAVTRISLRGTQPDTYSQL